MPPMLVAPVTAILLAMLFTPLARLDAFVPAPSPLSVLVTGPVALPMPLDAELQEAEPEDMSFALGRITVLTENQIALLQYGQDPAEARDVVYGCDDVISLSDSPPLVAGDDVVIEYQSSALGTPMARQVRRFPACEITAAELAATGKVVALTPEAIHYQAWPAEAPEERRAESGVPPEQDSQAGSPLQTIIIAPLPSSLVERLPETDGVEPTAHESYPPCPADGEEDETTDGTDRFSFGKIVAVEPQSIWVREYDFAKDAYVEVRYELPPEAEMGNITPERPLKVGDDVVLDYLENHGQRRVTTLVREELGDEAPVIEAPLPDPVLPDPPGRQN